MGIATFKKINILVSHISNHEIIEQTSLVYPHIKYTSTKLNLYLYTLSQKHKGTNPDFGGTPRDRDEDIKKSAK